MQFSQIPEYAIRHLFSKLKRRAIGAALLVLFTLVAVYHFTMAGTLVLFAGVVTVVPALVFVVPCEIFSLRAAQPYLAFGAITGGVADALQLFNRPVTRLDPYSTPNPRLFLCSASTPPGGGVHGMCGYWAARSALQRL